MSTLLVQLYWFSFVVIGLAVLIVVTSTVNNHVYRLNHWLSRLMDIHPIMSLLGTWCVGILVFAPLSVLGYVFELPLWPYVGLFVAVFALSVIIVTRNRKTAKKWLWRGLPKSNTVRLLVVMAVTVLGADYISSLIIQGSLTGDAPVHVSRINSMIGGNLSLGDPYLSYNGVVDPRYSTNLLAVIHAIGATILHITAVDMWVISGAFYRLIIWLSLFVFVWMLFPKRNRDQIAISLLIIFPLLYDVMFRNALFPDRIVYAFTALFLSGLVLWTRNKNPALLLIGACLIAVTHPINALVASGFLGLFAAVLFIFKRVTLKQLFPVIVAVMLLLIPVVINLMYPNRTALSDSAFNAGVISGNPVTYAHYGPLFIHTIKTPVNLISLLVIIVLALYAYSITKVRHLWLRRVTILLWIVATCLMYSPLLLSIVGFVYLLKINKDTPVRILIVLLMIFYGLIIYNPILIPIVHDKIPPWVIGRFQEFNLLSLILPCIGVYAWLIFSIKHMNISKKGRDAGALLYPIMAVLLIGMWPFMLWSTSQYSKFLHPRATDAFLIEQYRRASYSSRLKPLARYIDNNLVLTSSKETQFDVPMTTRAHVISLLDTNYSPMANIPLRAKCQNELVAKLAYVDLLASTANFVIVDLQDPNDKVFGQKVAKQKYLKFITEKSGLRLYKFNQKGGSTDPSSTCNIPSGQ